MKLFKKLNQQGAAHYVALAIILVGLAAFGTYKLVASHAQTIITNTVKNGLISTSGGYVMNPDGTSQKALLSDSDRVILGSRLAWSADGKKLAYVLNPGKATSTLVVNNAAGTAPKNILVFNDGTTITYPTWSPDGQWIAFQRLFSKDSLAVWLVHPDGTGLRYVDSPLSFDSNGYSWLSASKLLVLQSYGTVVKGGGQKLCQLNIIDASSTCNQILSGTTNAISLNVSRDASKIVFPFVNGSAMRKDGSTQATIELGVAHADGTSFKQVTNVGAGNEAEAPVWSPDGNFIAYEYHPFIEGTNLVYSMTSSGTGVKLLSNGIGSSPQWQAVLTLTGSTGGGCGTLTCTN